MSDERNPNKTRKQVEVWSDDFNWLGKAFHGATLSWATNLLLHSFREVCENPEKYNLRSIDALEISLAAAHNAKEEIDEGLHPLED